MRAKKEVQNQPKPQVIAPEKKAGEMTDEELGEVSGGYYRAALPYLEHDRLYSEVYLVINRPR